jgi:hypothetical protein
MTKLNEKNPGMAEQYSICYGHDDFSIYNEKGERIK